MYRYRIVINRQTILAVTTVVFLVTSLFGVYFFYRHHIVSYPINERVEVMISRHGKAYRAHVNVLTSFGTGFPDSTGSLEANDWPIQFRIPGGSVLFASVGRLLIEPDHYAERILLTDSGVERRDNAIKLFTGKGIDLCIKPNVLIQYQDAFLDCPTFFTFQAPDNLNSINIIKGPDVTHRLANGWEVVSVKVTLNEDPVYEPNISQIPSLPSNHALASRILVGKLYQKQLCDRWLRGENRSCKDLEN